MFADDLQIKFENSVRIIKSQNFQGDWEQYRLLYRNFKLFFVGSAAAFFLPFVIGLVDKNFSNLFYLSIPAGIFLVASAYYVLRLQSWNCPKCKNTFHRNEFYTWSYSSKCLHCGLRKYEGSIFKKL